MKKYHLFLTLLAGAFMSLSLHAQELKTLTPDDYDQWQSLRSTVLSHHGLWVSYQVAPNEGNVTLYFVHTQTGQVYHEAFGTRAGFSPDDRFALYLIGVSKKERDKMQEKKQDVHYKLAVLNLETGEKSVYPEVSAFRFPDKGSHALLTMYPPKGSTAKGSDRVLLNLDHMQMRTLGHISDAGFDHEGRYLAYITEPPRAVGYGVEVLDLNSQVVQVLASDTLSFSGLSWEKEGRGLAFFHQLKSDDYEGENYEILAYRNINKGWKQEVFNPLNFPGFTADMKIRDASLQWAEDLSALFFGIQPWEKKEQKPDKEQDSVKKPERKAEPAKLPGVDVWHWKDPDIQPRQKKTYSQDKNFAFLSMWNLNTGQFVQIADSVYRDVRLTGDQKHALLSTEKPYEPQFRLTYANYQIMNLMSGERKDFLKSHTGYISSSPDGLYILYFSDNQWYTYSIPEEKHINLTGELEQPFWNIRDDHPAEKRPPFGTGGWLKDDKAVLLYDEYDVWAFKPGGSSSERLTRGREDEIIFRVRKMDYREDALDSREPIYLSAFGDRTKKSGMFSLSWGKTPRELIFIDKSISAYQFTKAEEAERYMWVETTYADPPRLMVAGQDLSEQKEIIQINPQQKEFAWGRAELVDFTNTNGKDLQGVLHYPAGYEEGKKYPMLVYIYEIRSNSLHSYINPSTKSFYNITNYVQQGFFVFQPDIVYRLDDPGVSAVECVVPAVEKVLESGMVDKGRIGLMGHSWGAYQTAFIITQTDLFSAAVAGAPLTDMISMYTGVYWNTGSPNQGIFETSQGRFTRPYWEIMDKYIQNSPMFQAQRIETPLLVAFGDEDGAVDWHQGIELYTTMRRMEKPYVMLVYAGENHSVRKDENMLDYTKKINEWFNYYLLNQEPSEWIIEGIPYLEKMKKEEKQKKKKNK